MLRGAFLISFLFGLISFSSQAISNPTLDDQVVSAGAAVGVVIAAPIAGLAAAAISLPVAGFSMAAAPIYLFAKGEKKEAIEAIYMAPAGVMAAFGLSGVLFGAFTGGISGAVMCLLPAALIKLAIAENQKEVDHEEALTDLAI